MRYEIQEVRHEIRDCRSVADVLAGHDEAELPTVVARHVGECLRCQAELSGLRRLRRSLRELADAPVGVDPALHHEILFALDRADERSNRRLVRATAATIGGLAAAAGVIVVASRQIRSIRLAG